MVQYLLKKLPQLIVVMLGASFLTFTLTYFSPSDPAVMKFAARGVTPSKEALEETREQMGLNRPFVIQYTHWLGRVVVGDLGNSYISSRPIADILKQKIPMTLKLASTALCLLLFFSLLLGITSALYQNRIPDFLIRGLSFCKISFPEFWLGLILIFYFVVKLGWFKISDPYDPLSVVLPAVTLAVPITGRYIRLIRAVLLEELSKDYVIGARASGISKASIVFRHVLPNSLSGLLTLFGLSTAKLIGGTVVVESIFSWPGLGHMAIEAVTLRDYHLLQAYVLLMAVVFVSISFLVDIINKVIDPRITEKEQSKA